MSLDELLERLRDPRQLIPYLWFAWWLWSLVRGKLRRRAPEDEEQAETETQTQPPVPREAPPPARPVPPQPPARPAPPQPPARAARSQPTIPAPPRPTADDARASQRPATLVRRSLEPSEQREDAPWTQALARAHALRKRAADDRALRRLEPIIVAELIDPLQAALHEAGKSQRSPQVQARAASAVLTLGVLEHVFRERERKSDAARLAEVDAIVEACHAPLRHYARAEGLELRGVHPVATRLPLPHAVREPEWSSALLMLPVPAGFGTRLTDYTAVVHELGRRWYVGLPGLAREVQAELGLAPRVQLLDVRSSYDRTSVQAGFGAWLPSLFADTALTLRLGNGYATALRKSLASDAHVTRAQAEGPYLSSRPPGQLRMQAALNALAALGQEQAVEHHRAAFAAEHEGLERSHLPLADGRVLALDSHHLLEFTDVVSEVLLHTPQAGLGRVPLTQVPGLPQTLAEQREQQALAQAIARRHLPANVDPAQLLFAAQLAWEAGLDPELAVAQLHEALSPRPAQDVGATRDRRERARQTPRSLRAAFRDRRTLASAIVLGAALERPRSQR
jgi:hypothetical protein